MMILNDISLCLNVLCKKVKIFNIDRNVRISHVQKEVVLITVSQPKNIILKTR